MAMNLILRSVVLTLFTVVPGHTQPITLTDYRGDAIYFPQGARSFADNVLFTRVGTPRPVELKISSSALGVPDWNVPDTQSRNFPDQAFSLGCRGQLAVQFEDNALIDVAGPDLFVFEVGANVEPANVYVSNDGANWESVGSIGGALSTVDLATFSLSANSFRYVMIEDAGGTCSGITPGADIDAIGAIGSADRLTLAGEVLFDVGTHNLKPAAQRSLNAIAAQLMSDAPRKVEIVGHTDNSGSDAANYELGTKRAQSVAAYLFAQAADLRDVVSVASRGEEEPMTTNDNVIGRQMNRRVEITVFFD